MTWTIGSLGAGENAKLTFNVIVKGTGIIHNMAYISTNENNIGENVSNEVIVTVLKDENSTNQTNWTNRTDKTNNTNETKNNKTESSNRINETIITSANMKKTGMPIFLILMLITIFGISLRIKKG